MNLLRVCITSIGYQAKTLMHVWFWVSLPAWSFPCASGSLFFSISFSPFCGFALFTPEVWESTLRLSIIFEQSGMRPGIRDCAAMWLYSDTLKFSQPTSPGLSLFCGRVALSSPTLTNALQKKQTKDKQRETDKRLRDSSHPHASQWNSWTED